MKKMKKIFILVTFFLTPAITLAQTIMNKDMIKSTDTAKSLMKRPWNIGLVYDQQTDTSDEESIGLRGMNLQASRLFHLKGGFYTTSQLGSNNLSGTNSLDDFDHKSEYQGVHMTQRFSYLFKNFKYPIKPFIGIGLGSGSYTAKNTITNAQVRSDFGINSIDINSRYQMSSTVIGIETLVGLNLAPFISYTTTRVQYSEVKSKVNKNMNDFTIVDIDAELENITGSRITLGLNYRF